MKKAILIVLFLIAGSVFAQNYTFQGLPWGSTREQVVAKLGVPAGKSKSQWQTFPDFNYEVQVNGYLSNLKISFNDNGMVDAQYDIGWYQRLNSSQLLIAFGITAGEIIKKYGPYHEIFAEGVPIKNDEEHLLVWHFDNFHIMINTIVAGSNSLQVCYFSNLEWVSMEKILKNENWTRFPNSNL